MNKFVFIGVIALVLGTAGVLVMSGSKEDLAATSSETTNPETSPEQQQQIETILAQYTGNNGTYTHQGNSEELTVALANSEEGDKKILFFEGRTCPMCKELDKNIRAVDMPDNVNIYNILADDNPDLMQKYQVRGTPGLYQVDSEGNLIRQLQPVLQLNNILLQLI